LLGNEYGDVVDNSPLLLSLSPLVVALSTSAALAEFFGDFSSVAADDFAASSSIWGGWGLLALVSRLQPLPAMFDFRYESLQISFEEKLNDTLQIDTILKSKMLLETALLPHDASK
jgi:hypothetical protein